jgi:glycosyltransferase involved in cell wall biosynthesis
MGIHQVLVSASPRDAVTNSAFALRDLLRKVGPSEIISHYIDPELDDEVVHIGAYEGERGDVLVYHASIGEPAVVKFLLDRPEPLVLLYHNMTPARYFVTVDPNLAALLAAGREELACLAPRVTLALAVSEYNAADLETLGYKQVRIAPLVIDLKAFRAVEPDPLLAGKLAQLDGPFVVFVGQFLPHKRIDLLLAAFHVLTTYLVPEARLALVGPHRSAPYRQAMERIVGELSLDAWIMGELTDSELAAAYRRASCFVTMSEHEGVCVPLLEAMSVGVPVIARDCAAISETMGAAGLLLPAEEDVLLTAEAMAAVLTDQALATRLVDLGYRRAAQFDPAVAQAAFLQHLAEVV